MFSNKTLTIVEWSELVSNYCLDIDVLCIHLFLNYTVCNINLVTYTKLKWLWILNHRFKLRKLKVERKVNSPPLDTL